MQLPEQFIRTVGDWQERLLQLDRRNHLLYLNTESKAIVPINPDSPAFYRGRAAGLSVSDSIVDALGRAGDKGVSFDYAERVKGSSPDGVLRPGDLQSDCESFELQRRLGRLRKKQREWQEEQGLPILYLAIGLLRWADDKGDSAAPLLLLPCDLTRASLRSEFRLASTDDDFERNDTLGVQLNKLFGLTLPDIADAETLSDYFQSVRVAISGQPGWSVEDNVYLGAFAYSKLAMWRDLESLKTRGTDNEIVKVLSGLSSTSSPVATPSVIPSNPDQLAGGKLDDLLDLKDQFTVLRADYSQLTAVERAREGRNLVIHGPPGTGKSQTIANIISTFIAEEKSVLFVSEKTAALDVVKKRLDETGLGIFCLDLHSERGRKANVYAQLRESDEAPQLVKKKDRSLPALNAQRRKLNDAARALHAIRQPLNMSVYQVHGQYASLDDASFVSLSLPFTVTTMDQDWLAKMRNALNSIAQRRREYERHGKSHWEGVLLVKTPALGLSDKVRESMEDIRQTVLSVVDSFSDGAKFLGAPEPQSMGELRSLSLLLAHMKEAPGVPETWLSADAVANLSESVQEEKKAQTDRESAIAMLQKAWNSIPSWDFDDLLQRLTFSKSDYAALQTTLGEQWRKRLTANPSQLVVDAADAASKADAVSEAFKTVQEIFESAAVCERVAIKDHADLASEISVLAPVPAPWATKDSEIRALIDKAKQQASDLITAKGAIASKYDLEIVNEVDRKMLVRYRTDHQNGLSRLFSGQFRRDQKTLQGHQIEPAKLSVKESLSLVQSVIDLQEMQDNWDAVSINYQAAFGRMFQGKDTDWGLMEQSFVSTQDVVGRWPGSKRSLLALLVNNENVSQLMEGGMRLTDSADDLDKAIRLIAGDSLRYDYAAGEIPLADAAASLRSIIAILERIGPIVDQVVQESLTRPESINDVVAQIGAASRLREIENRAAQRESKLARQFGDRYSGFDTDWGKIRAAIQWTATFLQHATDDMRLRLVEHAVSPSKPEAYAERLAQVAQAESAFHDLQSRYAEIYDMDAGPWDSWAIAPFIDILAWTERLHADAENASDWITYRSAVVEADGLLGPGAVDKCREITPNSDEVPRMVERSVLGLWLGAIHQGTPELRGFASVDHEEIRRNFREIDRQFPEVVSSEIRVKMFQQYEVTKQSWGMRMLRNELTKKRRQKSARVLVQSIPDCIKAFKPCFMMSPLAVSQYLSHGDAAADDAQSSLPLTFKAAFDVVIFDEASQVFPWDAIPALLHAKQAIFAGDPKQLPPSTFWRHSGDDEEDYDDDDDSSVGEEGNALKDRESILDVAVNYRHALFHDSYLDMHYRSRHEDLIRFSNRHFYGERLLTFPTPGIRDERHGVHRHFLPDARYDRGGARTNRGEAEKVVELVVEHLRTRPAKSLGVAAMSRPQADLIERLIEERLLDERDAEDARQRMSEPLFVKNLENVQGDERDRIIISIGYGPTTPSGATPNNFGPLNREEGDRRLNVLVTRARERMDIVHSIEPSRITSKSDGARLLRRFLEYAANPRADLGDGPSTALAQPTDVELNDFEKSVQDALLARGHRVVGQVGSAGYRIDLAILSEDGARYDLGVECDGATYHSAPAARDRDWLRQSVLEGLGWTIHRVWSTSWVRNPTAEIERVEEALSRARSHTPPTPPPSRGASEEESASTDEEGEVSLAGAAADHRPHALAPYCEADLSGFHAASELRDARLGLLMEMAAAVAKVEGPVHPDIVMERIRERYAVSRLRGSTRASVEYALRLAVKENRIRLKDGFLYAEADQLSREPRSCVDNNIDHAPPSELRTLIIRVADAFRGPRDHLVAETAKALGFTRTGQRIAERLNNLIDALLSEERLEESGGIIRAPRSRRAIAP